MRPIYGIAPFLALLSLGGCDSDPTVPGSGTGEPAVDAAAPVVEILQPGDSVYQAQLNSVLIRGIATDSAGVARVTVQHNGREEREVAITPGTSVLFVVEGNTVGDGANDFVFHAYDAAGNRGSSRLVRTDRDRSAPAIELGLSPGALRQPDGSIRTASDSLALEIVVRDRSRVVEVRYKLEYDGPTGMTTLPGLPDTLVTRATSFPVRPGRGRLEVFAIDGRGNFFPSLTTTVERYGVRFEEAGTRCAASRDGTAYCWGGMSFGSTWHGDRYLIPVELPAGVTAGTVSAGSKTACAVATDGAAYCWGSGDQGQLGDGGSRFESLTPLRVAGGHAFSDVAVGETHACALTPAGAPYCWGSAPQHGAGGTAHQRSPVAVAGGLELARISAGAGYTCGVTKEGDGYCWGDNTEGQLGNGTTTTASAPTPVSGALEFLSIAAGSAHTCGVTTGGDAYCWGSTNAFGQLGNGEVSNSARRVTEPVPVTGGLKFLEVAVGSLHSCGLTTDRDIYCWGQNASGQLGNGRADALSATPTRVAGSHRFDALDAEGKSSAGLTTDGLLLYWGQSASGTADRAPAPLAGQQ